MLLVLPVLSILSVLVDGCDREGPENEAPWEAIGTWPPGLRECLGLADGQWRWRWSSDDGSRGEASLTLADGRYRWRLDGFPPAAAVTLEAGSGAWLGVRVPEPDALAGTPPLPRLACDSDEFTDLVAFLRALITPRFGGIVAHWPSSPIPVRAGAASSDGLDLAACLREAVDIWNQGASPFVWDAEASWGVSLAHYAGSSRSPPMQLKITRLDSLGRPLRARIAVGDDYGAGEGVYALRAMAHELAHAALLWGHSPDRRHLLWGDAPPLRGDPSQDERRAVELLHLLPEGLDLGRYLPP